ncbi:sensor histidine kinase [Shouchella patagoniensis]|uniref:sensor histidine kinase n=1 Tax=Shouchella patagoniensis TaxID=228576 RepID=UPI000994D426|nr:HAMP domain-containing sensor histidine kinase [Shouchella patagoniensis]
MNTDRVKIDEEGSKPMLIALVLLSSALIIQTVYVLYYKKQIKEIGDQLSFITKHDSFKFIQTQMKPNEIVQLIDVCNTMLRHQRDMNQQFIKKSEEINTTIVSLSHDIRTPMTSLDGYLQLANRSENAQEKTKYVKMAQTRIKQITTLVDELFLYTKLQNRDYVFDLESIDVINGLKRSLFSFVEEFSKSDEEPIFTLPETAIVIIGNESALERVWENIIRNYFLHGEGALSIRYEEKENEVLFHFNNMLKQNHSLHSDHVFTRFYKEDLSRTNHSSGLGLSIVQSLVEKMAGSVYAELKGNSFCISVALVKPK